MKTNNEQLTPNNIIQYAETCPIDDLVHIKKQIGLILEKRQKRYKKQIMSVKRKLKTNADSDVIAFLEQLKKEES